MNSIVSFFLLLTTSFFAFADVPLPNAPPQTICDRILVHYRLSTHYENSTVLPSSTGCNITYVDKDGVTKTFFIAVPSFTHAPE